MLYFIPWVVFLSAVILAVPIAAWLEKRKYRAAFPETEPDEALAEDDYPAEEPIEMSESADMMEQAEQPMEPEFEVPGGDDFSAFDEEFK